MGFRQRVRNALSRLTSSNQDTSQDTFPLTFPYETPEMSMEDFLMSGPPRGMSARTQETTAKTFVRRELESRVPITFGPRAQSTAFFDKTTSPPLGLRYMKHGQSMYPNPYEEIAELKAMNAAASGCGQSSTVPVLTRHRDFATGAFSEWYLDTDGAATMSTILPDVATTAGTTAGPPPKGSGLHQVITASTNLCSGFEAIAQSLAGSTNSQQQKEATRVLSRISDLSRRLEALRAVEGAGWTVAHSNLNETVQGISQSIQDFKYEKDDPLRKGIKKMASEMASQYSGLTWDPAHAREHQEAREAAARAASITDQSSRVGAVMEALVPSFLKGWSYVAPEYTERSDPVSNISAAIIGLAISAPLAAPGWIASKLFGSSETAPGPAQDLGGDPAMNLLGSDDSAAPSHHDSFIPCSTGSRPGSARTSRSLCSSSDQGSERDSQRSASESVEQRFKTLEGRPSTRPPPIRFNSDFSDSESESRHSPIPVDSYQPVRPRVTSRHFAGLKRSNSLEESPSHLRRGRGRARPRSKDQTTTRNTLACDPSQSLSSLGTHTLPTSSATFRPLSSRSFPDRQTSGGSTYPIPTSAATPRPRLSSLFPNRNKTHHSKPPTVRTDSLGSHPPISRLASKLKRRVTRRQEDPSDSTEFGHSLPTTDPAPASCPDETRLGTDPTTSVHIPGVGETSTVKDVSSNGAGSTKPRGKKRLGGFSDVVEEIP